MKKNKNIVFKTIIYFALTELTMLLSNPYYYKTYGYNSSTLPLIFINGIIISPLFIYLYKIYNKTK